MREECLVKDCKRLATRRGLCVSHYQTAWNKIKENPKISWDNLIKAGLAKEAYQGRVRYKTKFTSDLNELIRQVENPSDPFKDWPNQKNKKPT